MPLKIKNLKLSYGERTVIKNINLNIKDNQVTVILGASGCGKTSLLNVIAGMIKPASGSVAGVNKDELAYIFQEHRLLPWKTVKGNLNFILGKKFSEGRRSEIIRHTLEILGLWDSRNYYPFQLSGGMKQRVSIARAFVYPSKIILMDEAFKGLDIKRKMTLIDYFVTLWEESPKTVVLVTHDIQEALLLGDEIHIMSEKTGNIIKSFEILINKKNRDLASAEISIIESELYKCLLEE